jgi:hypothetical protein
MCAARTAAGSTARRGFFTFSGWVSTRGAARDDGAAFWTLWGGGRHAWRIQEAEARASVVAWEEPCLAFLRNRQSETLILIPMLFLSLLDLSMRLQMLRRRALEIHP